MPKKSKNLKKSKCLHTSLVYHPSPHQHSTTYTQPTVSQLLAAATSQGKFSSTVTNLQHTVPSQLTFPAPLVLPGDDLALKPKEAAQSYRSWSQGHFRNKVTAERQTIYVVSPPQIEEPISFVRDWRKPKLITGKEKGKRKRTTGNGSDENVDIEHVIEYLTAFYHGMPIKHLPPTEVNFTEWEKPEIRLLNSRFKKSASKTFIGLTTPSLSGLIKTRIRTRTTPEGDFPAQLNLSDILDAMISALPEDAYAIVMLVDHDLYEDEEDEFVCGRAYGGSRVAVISTARYDPALDRPQEIEREHAWPAAHCEAYVSSLAGEEDPEVVVTAFGQKKGIAKKYKEEGEVIVIDSSSDDENEDLNMPGAMELAVKAHTSLPSLEASPSSAALAGLWLGRVCRTTAHEIGHCFGIGHCSYYACSMQGSASIIEDARQPPYLCPVDLAKVLNATEGDMIQRYEALLLFLEKHKDTHLFASYAAWISHRLTELSS